MRVATGIDIGHHTVRAVVLGRTKGSLRVLASAAVQRLDKLGEPKPIPLVVSELDAIVRFRGELVCADTSIDALVRFIATLPLPKDRLARLLRLELTQHADGTGDLAADSVIVPIAGDEMMHCCVLAQPAQVYSALVDLREAKAGEAMIQFTPAANFNATLPLPPVKDEDIALLVDIGSHATGITLFGDDRFLACRQVAAGGDAFTEALIAAGLDRVTAEQAKREMRRMASASAGGDEFERMLDKTLAEQPAAEQAPEEIAHGDQAHGEPATKPASSPSHGTAEDFIVIEDHHADGDHADPDALSIVDTSAPTRLAQAGDAASTQSAAPSAAAAAPADEAQAMLDPRLGRPADALLGQIVSSLTFFKTQLKQRTLEPKLVLLAGGAAATPGLANYLSKRLSLPVRMIDPFAAIDQGAKLQDGHEWTAAVGLALTAPALKQRGAVRFDLRPETLIKKQLWQTRLVWPYVAAAMILVATVFGIFALHASYSAQQDNLDRYNDYAAQYKKDKATLDQLDLDKQGLSTDLRAIASRIYAGRDILELLRALKERTHGSEDLWVTKIQTHEVGQDANVVKELEDQGNAAVAGGGNTIDRGQVDIDVNLKFEQLAKSEHERFTYLREWEDFVRNWSPPGAKGARLFKDAEADLPHDDPNKTAAHKGTFKGTVHFFFAPTDLSLVTSAGAIAGSR